MGSRIGHRVVAVAGLLAVSGCIHYEWRKPGATPQATAADRTDCGRLAAQQAQMEVHREAMVSSAEPCGGAIGRPCITNPEWRFQELRDQHEQTCMHERGYLQVPSERR
jgi:hypothetical protein